MVTFMFVMGTKFPKIWLMKMDVSTQSKPDREQCHSHCMVQCLNLTAKTRVRKKQMKKINMPTNKTIRETEKQAVFDKV